MPGESAPAQRRKKEEKKKSRWGRTSMYRIVSEYSVTLPGGYQALTYRLPLQQHGRRLLQPYGAASQRMQLCMVGHKEPQSSYQSSRIASLVITNSGIVNPLRQGAADNACRDLRNYRYSQYGPRGVPASLDRAVFVTLRDSSLR